MKRIFCCLALTLVFFQINAQITYPNNGTVSKDIVPKVFKNAVLHLDHENLLKGADLLILGDKIQAYGYDIEIPEGAVVYDLAGLHIYPSFIDLSSHYGIAKLERPKWKPAPQYESKTTGAFGWNQAIKPEVEAALIWSPNQSDASNLMKKGFGTVLTHQKDGIARGSATLVTLGENKNKSMLMPIAAAEYSFRKGSSRQKYPSSQMGAIALLRQTYYDAEWYSTDQNLSERNLSLEAWNKTQNLPQIFNVGDKLQALRADKIGDEFAVQYIIRSAGDEYQRIEELKNSQAVFIVPLNFPAPYDVSDINTERLVSLEEMKHWELAPFNPRILEENEIEFCITSEGLSADQFIKNLRKAVDLGLSKEQALKSLTTIPASLVNASDRVGKIAEGMEANFIICSDDFFESETKIYENWVQGERNQFLDWNVLDLSGEYEFTIKDETYDLKIDGDLGKYSSSFEVIADVEDDQGELKKDTINVSVKLKQLDRQVSMTFTNDKVFKGAYRLTGNIFKDSKIWEGQGVNASGEKFDWVAVRQGEEKPDSNLTIVEANDTTLVDFDEIPSIIYPLMGYGWENEPIQKTILFKNAMLWTCEDDEPIRKGQLLIHEGKILAVGESIDLEVIFPKHEIQPLVMDCKGKHISPGIIDEHSHIAVSGSVNESAQTSSAEVNIGTVVDSDDVDIYRQLAGGVTASQLLHGSANPIGGQSGMIKLRWGQSPDEMLIENATPFIKFALGENVKQSNWGDYERIRFPQTRMGVEQAFYDHFIRAKEYDEQWNQYETSLANLTKKEVRKGINLVKPRTDLELECLAQIVNSERFITCHSYRQDEINMLMHVADSMGFRLNTFTHILEGYKVADKMKSHGAGGSTFSDWWAYKYEVKDAIPHNAAILYEQGVVTAINSDDAEMARRLNQEAAKTVMYGSVPEMEALKMVTLNPAKLLHLDDQMGSLKAGKDADIVIWTDHPLSIYAKAERTFVDGKEYFSIEQDKLNRERIKKERSRLIQAMLLEASGGAKTQKPKLKSNKKVCCDSEGDDSLNYILE